MNAVARICVATVLLALVACSTTASKLPPTWEGLELYPQTKFKAVYLKPGANFAPYNQFILDRAEVSFDRNWDPRSSGSLRQADTAKIKTAVSDTFQTVFLETMQLNGDFKVATQPGPEVLQISPAIVNLYISAPDLGMQTAGKTTTYTVDPGQLTLVAEFRDSSSGTLLARVVDSQRATSSGMLQVANAVTNMSDARRIMTRWATVIREGLESLSAAPVTIPPSN